MRHTAFKRGIAYLERYCLLIAFAAFLERAQVPSLCAAVLHAMDQCQWGPGLGVKTGACCADTSSCLLTCLLTCFWLEALHECSSKAKYDCTIEHSLN